MPTTIYLTKSHLSTIGSSDRRGRRCMMSCSGLLKPRAVADDLIYNSGNTFAIPLFLYKIDLGSDIHDIHVDVFHRSSHDGLWNFWKTNAIDQEWGKIFEYDPYMGTLPPGFEGK